MVGINPRPIQAFPDGLDYIEIKFVSNSFTDFKFTTLQKECHIGWRRFYSHFQGATAFNQS